MLYITRQLPMGFFLPKMEKHPLKSGALRYILTYLTFYFSFVNNSYIRHTFWSWLARCVNIEWIPLLLLKLHSGHNLVYRRTDRRTDKVKLQLGRGYYYLYFQFSWKIILVLVESLVFYSISGWQYINTDNAMAQGTWANDDSVHLVKAEHGSRLPASIPTQFNCAFVCVASLGLAIAIW